MARSGLFVPALLLALVAPGCGREASETGRGEAQPREDAAAAPIPLRNVRPDWEVNRALPQQKGAGPFEARSQATPLPHPAAQARAAVPDVRPTPTPPPPFAYVGKVARGQIGFAVLVRDERVFVVHAGDIAEGWRVQSVGEREVVLVSLESGVAQSLAFSSASGPNVLPAAATESDAAGAADDASPQPTEPGG